MSKTKWRQVSVPNELLSEVELFVKNNKKKYASPSEFVRHAISEKLKREFPMREEIHIKDESNSLSLMDFKDGMSGTTSTREKKKKSRVNPSLEESADQAAVKG